MSSSKRAAATAAPGIAVAVAAVGLTWPALGAADVVVEERIDIGGPMSRLMKLGGTTTTAISGRKARIDSDIGCQGGMLKAFCPKGATTQIVRLDRDATWTLDPEKKTWFEESFADFRRRQAEAVEQLGKATEAQPGAGPAEEECEWSPPKGEVRRTGEKGTFAGHEAERATVVVTTTCRYKKDPAVACDVRWTADQWLTRADLGRQEADAFWQAYAKALGAGELLDRSMQAQAAAYAKKYEGLFKELGAQMKGLEGQALKSTLALAMGGPECRDAREAAAAGAAPAPSAGEVVGGAAGSTVGSAVGGSIGGAIGGALGSMFGRKKKDAAAEPAAAKPADDYVSLFEMTTEVKSITAAPVAADRFEVPAGFKKVAAPGGT